jgi:hypothetical protein
MLRSYKLAVATLCLSGLVKADDQALWKEYGLTHTETSKRGRLTVTTYQLKDVTGALAAWEWLRSPNSRACDLAPFCAQDGSHSVVSDYNYVLVLDGGPPRKPEVDAIFQSLPDKHDTSLPAILTFLPHTGLVANSARYVLGPASLAAFAPELAGAKPGFEQGAEAQVARYRVAEGESPVNLGLFYYPTPEMARIHLPSFKRVVGPHAKRSGVLVAVVYGNATDQQADTLLSRVQYDAKITWNEVPPPSPIKPLYQLLLNILYLSALLSGLCLVAGLIYAGMRIYRRRYGTLDAEEAMTTLHLTGD